jgi:YCII-related domain
MAKYVLAYRGGSMPATPAEQEAVMAAWVGWFGELGSAVLDGGNPFGPSMSVASDGSMKDGSDAGLTGYSVLTADSLAAATDLAKGCPVLANGGSVEVYEAIDM